MGPTDRPEPAAGDESSTTIIANGSKHGEASSTDEGSEADEVSACMQRRLEECADAEADEMASSMRRRLDALPGKAHESEPFTIFRVAGPMRDRNRHLYEPQMVSIGPFHRGAARLRAMEEHKWRYLRDLLARNNDATTTLAAYARAARELEPAARRRYAEPVHLTAREFAEMLLLDGCFVVEFFLKGEDRAADAMIDAAWAMQNVYSDLFLLENQIPFFVVERFYDIATGGLDCDYLVTNLLAKYLTIDTPQDAATARPPDGEILHLLHLYYHWFLPPEDRTNDSGGGSGSGSSKEEDEAWEEWLSKPVHERMPWQMPPATELQDAGVTIRAKRSHRSLVDVTFAHRGGALEIPAVESYGTSRATLANLVAYEQSRGRWEMQRVASYVLLMASLVHGRRDAEAMQRAGVLAAARGGGGGETAAAFYAHLCPPPDAVNNCYGELYRDVREYSGRSWNRHRAVLAHDYFSNPWTSMSAAAAVLLLVLTVVQTVYTVLPYYHPS
uniref:Uncharacterized protein n=1 Tax=Leersia perrieri TaxID=77586 RepID=A0A0D9WHH6_9ORYZ